MSNVSDKSCIYRSYPKLAYGSINIKQRYNSTTFSLRFLVKTLSITDLDANATILPAKTFANGSVAELSIDGSR